MRGVTGSAVGLLQLSGYGVLGRRYWCKVPLRGTLLSLTLYALALIAAAA